MYVEDTESLWVSSGSNVSPMQSQRSNLSSLTCCPLNFFSLLYCLLNKAPPTSHLPKPLLMAVALCVGHILKAIFCASGRKATGSVLGNELLSVCVVSVYPCICLHHHHLASTVMGVGIVTREIIAMGLAPKRLTSYTVWCMALVIPFSVLWGVSSVLVSICSACFPWSFGMPSSWNAALESFFGLCDAICFFLLFPFSFGSLLLLIPFVGLNTGVS